MLSGLALAGCVSARIRGKGRWGHEELRQGQREQVEEVKEWRNTHGINRVENLRCMQYIYNLPPCGWAIKPGWFWLAIACRPGVHGISVRVYYLELRVSAYITRYKCAVQLWRYKLKERKKKEILWAAQSKDNLLLFGRSMQCGRAQTKRGLDEGGGEGTGFGGGRWININIYAIQWGTVTRQRHCMSYQIRRH